MSSGGRRLQDVPADEKKSICQHRMNMFAALPRRVRARVADSLWGSNDQIIAIMLNMHNEGCSVADIIERFNMFEKNVTEGFYKKRMYPRPEERKEDAYRITPFDGVAIPEERE